MPLTYSHSQRYPKGCCSTSLSCWAVEACVGCQIGSLVSAKTAVHEAPQLSAGTNSLPLGCATFYSARQANANIGSLAITMNKQPRLSSVSSTLTSRLVPSSLGCFRSDLTQGEAGSDCSLQLGPWGTGLYGRLAGSYGCPPPWGAVGRCGYVPAPLSSLLPGRQERTWLRAVGVLGFQP